MARPMSCADPDALHKALVDLDDAALRELGTRLAQSHGSLSETLHELEAERGTLQDENGKLRETIDFMFKELRKLKIGADNIVEPMLEEGPLDFLDRYWERARPRENGYVVSEHVGELKKVETETPTPLELAKVSGNRVVTQISTNVGPAVANFSSNVSNLSTNVGPLMQKAGDVLKDELSLAPPTRGSQKQKTKSIKQPAQVDRPKKESALPSEARRNQPSSPPVAASGHELFSNISNAFRPFMRKAGEFLQDELSLAPPGHARQQTEQAKQHKVPRRARANRVAESHASGSSSQEEPTVAVRATHSKAEAYPPSKQTAPISVLGSALSKRSDDFQLGFVASTTASEQSDSATSSKSETASMSPPPSSATTTRSEQSDSTSSSKSEAPTMSQISSGANATSLEMSDSAAISTMDTRPLGQPSSEASPDTEALVIDALITVEQGKSLNLRVGAAERSKQVAKQFVKNHGLEPSCADALTAWLKRAEDDAVKYPVKIEGDLQDICKKHLKT